jgi:hypothetical protein
MNDMLTPRVTELVRQGNVVTYPLHLQEPLLLQRAAPHRQAPAAHRGG